jgi:hypothetical protein
MNTQLTRHSLWQTASSPLPPPHRLLSGCVSISPFITPPPPLPYPRLPLSSGFVSFSSPSIPKSHPLPLLFRLLLLSFQPLVSPSTYLVSSPPPTPPLSLTLCLSCCSQLVPLPLPFHSPSPPSSSASLVSYSSSSPFLSISLLPLFPFHYPSPPYIPRLLPSPLPFLFGLLLPPLLFPRFLSISLLPLFQYPLPFNPPPPQSPAPLLPLSPLLLCYPVHLSSVPSPAV